MATIFDYLRWRGDLLFEQAPQNEIDHMIFSLLSYIDFSDFLPSGFGESISLQAVANSYFAAHPNPKKTDLGFLLPKDIFKLFRTIRETKRFGNVRMCGFVNEIDTQKEMQFSAITFLLNADEVVVAYRGTDDTLVGWKEDLNMSFLSAVPAQERAAEYLNQAATAYAGRISLTGHSKGGNLAIYAGTRCLEAVRERIFGIWNFDGPGFNSEMLSDPAYLEVRDRINTLIPQSSIVGILLEHDENAIIVKSRQIGGVLQHDPFSWVLFGASFVQLPPTAGSNRRNDQIINHWIRELSPQQREQFTEAIYQILSSDRAMTVTDLASPKNLWVLRSMKLEPKVRKVVFQTLLSFFGEGTKELLQEVFGKRKTSAKK